MNVRAGDPHWNGEGRKRMATKESAQAVVRQAERATAAVQEHACKAAHALERGQPAVLGLRPPMRTFVGVSPSAPQSLPGAGKQLAGALIRQISRKDLRQIACKMTSSPSSSIPCRNITPFYVTSIVEIEP